MVKQMPPVTVNVNTTMTQLQHDKTHFARNLKYPFFTKSIQFVANDKEDCLPITKKIVYMGRASNFYLFFDKTLLLKHIGYSYRLSLLFYYTLYRHCNA